MPRDARRREAAVASPSNGTCRELAPLLCRLAEGEATPKEAMRSARHLSDCTACRITLARERRLAAMLEQGLEDPVPVGEDFVRAVMETLPLGPPPAPRRRCARRHLKLAGLLALSALAPLISSSPHGAESAGEGLSGLLPLPQVPIADGLADGVLHLSGLLLTAVDRLAAAAALGGDLPLPGLVAGLALVPLALATLLAWAGALGLAALRPRPDSARRT